MNLVKYTIVYLLKRELNIFVTALFNILKENYEFKKNNNRKFNIRFIKCFCL